LLFLDGGLDAPAIGLMAALYTGTWGIAQLGTGAISDRVGRRVPIAAGLGVQGLALAWIAAAEGTGAWGGILGAVRARDCARLPGAAGGGGRRGRAGWRATAVGVYRLWRDGGYVAGALGASLLADAFGVSTRGVVLATGVVATIAAFDVWRALGRERMRPAYAHDGRGHDGIA
jgi:MFS family permease